MTPKFPARTVVLMVLTLAAFGWFWWQARKLRSSPASVILVRPASIDAGPTP